MVQMSVVEFDLFGDQMSDLSIKIDTPDMEDWLAAFETLMERSPAFEPRADRGTNRTQSGEEGQKGIKEERRALSCVQCSWGDIASRIACVCADRKKFFVACKSCDLHVLWSLHIVAPVLIDSPRFTLHVLPRCRQFATDDIEAHQFKLAYRVGCTMEIPWRHFIGSYRLQLGQSGQVKRTNIWAACDWM